MAIIVDCDHLLHRIFFVRQAEIGQEPNLLAHMLLNSILKTAEKFGASKENPLFIAIDSRSWRKEWYAANKPKSYPVMEHEGYKGDREGKASDTWDKVYEVYHGVMEELGKHSDFHVLKVPRAEGDDIVAVLTKIYKPTQKVWVVSSDKDFIQLSDGDQVVVYDPIALTFKKDVNVETYMKVHILKAGDDNIANISKGKKIEKLLRELDSNLATDHAFKANYEFNRTLIDFNCIPEDVFSAIEDAANSCSFNYNCMELLTVFSKFRLVQMAEKVGKFKLPDASVPPPAKASESVKRAIQGSLEDFF